MKLNMKAEVLVKLLKEKSASVHSTSAAAAPVQLDSSELNSHITTDAKPDFHRGKHPKDEVRYAARQRAKERKRSKRNRKNASLNPQGGSYDDPLFMPTNISTTKSWRDEIYTRLSDVSGACFDHDSERKRWADEVTELSTSISGSDSNINLANVMVRLLGFLGGLAGCQSKREATNLCFALLAQYFDTRYLDQIYDMCNEELTPQSDTNENVFSQIKLRTSTLASTPCGKFLFNIFSLSVMSGCTANKLIPFNETRLYLKRIEQDIYRTSTMKSYFDCLLDIGEYVASAYDAIRKGTSFREFIFPNTLQQEIVDVVIMTERIVSGDVDDSDPEFLHRSICQAVELGNRLKKLMISCGDAKTSHWMKAGYESVNRARIAIEQVKAKSDFRSRPLCIGLFGKSSIGKTNLYPHIRNVVGAAFGKIYAPHEITTISDVEKYEDAIKNCTKVLQIDDIASLKPSPGNHAEGSAAKLVRIVNNVPQPTNQSNVANKDKISHQEELVIISSNVRNFGVTDSFRVPIAAANRIMMVHVELKDEYAVKGKLNEALVLRLTAENGGICPQIHTFKVYEYIAVGDGTEITENPVTGEMSTEQFFVYLADRACKHNASQLALREIHRRQATAVMCSSCFQEKGSYCKCAGPPLEMDPALIRLREQSFVSAYMFTMIDDMALELMFRASRYFGWMVTSVASRFIQRNAFRTFVFTIATMINAFKYLKYLEMRVFAFIVMVVLWYNGSLFFLNGLTSWKAITIGLFVPMFAFFGYGNALMDSFMYSATRSFMNRETRSILCTSLAVCGFIGVIRRLYSMQQGADEAFQEVVDNVAVQPPERWFSNQARWQPPVVREAQGNIMPKIYQDVVARHKEPNPWVPDNVKPVIFTNECKTMTFDQTLNCVEKSFFKIAMIDMSQKRSCFALHLCDTIWAVPKHVFVAMSNKHCQVELSKPGHRTLVSSISAFHIPADAACDTALVQIMAIGDFPDMTKFLPEGNFRDQALKFVTRREALEVDLVYGRNGLITSSSGVLPATGIVYTRKVPTVDGDCCSLLFTESKPHALVGFHCAGDNRGNCAAAVFKREWISDFQRKTFDFKAEGDAPLPFGLGDDVNLDPFDLGPANRSDEFLERHTVVQRYEEGSGVSPVAYMPNLKAHPKTQMSYGILKEPLERLGISIDYGPPKFYTDRDHDVALEAIHNGATLIPPNLLAHAIRDYVDGLIPSIKAMSMSRRGPLSLEEVMNGVPENKFIGPLRETTASGFGAHGKKTRDFLRVAYDVTGRKYLEATDLLASAFDKGMAALRKGFRMNPVFRTSIKDEAVKLEHGIPKKANRVFYGCQTDALCCAKALFAPVAAAVFEFPLISECAGGLNSFGDEWGQAYEYLVAFGEDHILAGDYKNYDQSMSSQLIRAAGVVCLHIAEALGYEDGDLIAMNAVVSDIACSYIAFNGALCSFDCLMPSGTFCTLLFNSIVNSLIHRCAFFAPGFDGTLVHSEDLAFRETCHFLFLGDDSIGGSRYLNQRDVSAFCKSINLVYTDDKKSLDSVDAFQNIKDCNFCKRSFRYEPYLGHHLAPLALPSIDKALYMYRDGEMDPVTYAVQAVEAQMREYARHEHSVFEDRRKVLTLACVDADIYLHVALILAKTREDWLDDFNVRYFASNIILSDMSDEEEEASSI